MGTTIIELESSHVPILSQPDAVLEVIREAAEATEPYSMVSTPKSWKMISTAASTYHILLTLLLCIFLVHVVFSVVTNVQSQKCHVERKSRPCIPHRRNGTRQQREHRSTRKMPRS